MSVMLQFIIGFAIIIAVFAWFPRTSTAVAGIAAALFLFVAFGPWHKANGSLQWGYAPSPVYYAPPEVAEEKLTPWTTAATQAQLKWLEQRLKKPITPNEMGELIARYGRDDVLSALKWRDFPLVSGGK